VKKRIVVAVVIAVLLAVSAYAQTTNFFQLAQSGTAQDVQAAISKGADVNAPDKTDPRQKTPLMYAARFNPNPEVITVLLKAGAKIEAHDPGNGSTPLMHAAYNNPNPEVITTLLKAGANIEARDFFGGTPLIVAAMGNKNSEVITVLLKAGADIEARDTDFGSTALIHAAQYNPNPEGITILLKAGANAKVRDNAGMTALDHAKSNYSLKGTDALKQLEEASK
jgi:ankyrin repeat protein